MLLPLPLLLLACSQESSISGRIEQAPQVSIQAPLDGDVLSEDEAIEFVGLVTDGNGLGDLVVLSWESDRQGELATQDDARWDGEGLSRFATTLDPGTHAISLSVVDSTERTAQASISITVEEVNTAPTAEITSPGAFESFSLGSDITLVGGASDPNQPADELIATWTWEPELGGSATEIATVSPTATGTVLSTWEQPPVGSYRLRLLITDAEGQEADAEVVINVEDPNAGDADQDGWTLAQGDCDDNDPDVNPAAAELCNSIDDDCNGDIDDKDDDGDDHVDIDCVDHEGPLPADDCDDDDPTTYMGAPEQADGADNDCNGLIDDGLSNFDNDGDCACTASTCIGSVDPKCMPYLTTGDCDDSDPALNPYDDDGDGWSTCDGDCDDLDAALNLDDADGDTDTTCATDCDDSSSLLNGLDVDGDSFSSCDGDCNDGDASVLPLDLDGDGATSCTGDCNDSDASLNPDDVDGDGYSTCDGDCDDNDDVLTPIDSDGDGASTCDGDCDDSNNALNQLDGDGDTFSTCDGDCNDANPGQNLWDNDGDGYSSCAGDCDDASSALNPADADGDGYSTCDNDCDDNDAALDPADIDGDGYSSCQGDCNDNNASLDPADADGDSYSTCDGDCDDGQSLANPGRTEVPYNGIDDDCAGGDLVDVDGDGYTSTIAGGTDCDDNDATVNPGRTETCNGKDDDCNQGIDEDGASGCSNRWTDADGDGYGVGSSTCTCDTSGATQGGDCYDGNANARPGQTSYFVGDRGDGSWDYNCDGNESRFHTTTATWDCNLCGFLNTDCCYDVGWIGGRPECGESAEWNQGCYWVPAIECNPSQNSYIIYDQTCR